MKKPIFILPLLMASAVTANAVTLINERFQSTIYTNGTASPGFAGWTYSSPNTIRARTTTADIPGDTDFATNQVIQIENIASLNYALTHTWSSTDVFTLTFNASPQAWSLADQRYVRPMIYQTNGDVLLWDPGETTATALPSATGYAWNGPGLYGNSTWQDEPTSLYTFTINASEFSTGAEGESIYLSLTQSGTRGMYYDNVVLSEGAVPEPSTGLFGILGMLGLLIRRRR